MIISVLYSCITFWSYFQEFDHPSEDVENTIPESSLISLAKRLEEELEIQDIPMAPIVVYLEDKDTHAIIGIKVKEEIHCTT